MADDSESCKQPDSERYGVPWIDSGARGVPLPSTITTMLEQIQRGNEASVYHFYCRYATPVFCYFRARGHQDEAKDLTLVVLAKLLAGEPLGEFKPDEGRFRPYLRQALANIRVDWLRHERAAVRYPPGGVASLERVLEKAGDYLGPADGEKPEDVFDRQYAHELLNVAIERVQSECETDGLSAHFDMFAKKHLEIRRLTWAQIGAEYELDDDQARNRARTVQERLSKALSEELRTTGMTDTDVEDEIRDLIRAFQRRSGSAYRRR